MSSILFLFFFNDTATTEIYTLSLHDALPIWGHLVEVECDAYPGHPSSSYYKKPGNFSRYGEAESPDGDRKSTRLNSSHSQISYAVFCLKKKNRLHPTLQIIAHHKIRHGHRRT